MALQTEEAVERTVLIVIAYIYIIYYYIIYIDIL